MRNVTTKARILPVAGALAIVALAAVVAASSEAQSGTMHNCPAEGKWSIAVWDGASGTAASDVLTTCGPGAVAAAYSLDPQTGGWSRWFAGKPDVSNLPPLNDMQGVLALGAAPILTPTSTPTASATVPAELVVPRAGTYDTVVDSDRPIGELTFTYSLIFDVVEAQGDLMLDFVVLGCRPTGTGGLALQMIGDDVAIEDGKFGLQSNDLVVEGHFVSSTTAVGTIRALSPAARDCGVPDEGQWVAEWMEP